MALSGRESFMDVHGRYTNDDAYTSLTYHGMIQVLRFSTTF